MKLPVIDLELLAEDIRAWGVPAAIRYDEGEEAFVLHAGNEILHGPNKGQSEITIAPGFEYRKQEAPARILAYSANLYVNITDAHPVNSSLRSRIISQSRLEHHRNEKSELIMLSGIGN